jgi:hypothetical protein
MARRRLLLLWLFVSLGLAAIGLGAFGIARSILRPEPGVTRENFRRLHFWMSPQEAETILGGPAKDKQYVTGGFIEHWKSDGLTICLLTCGPNVLGGQLTMADGSAEPLRPEPSRETILDRVRRWLRF